MVIAKCVCIVMIGLELEYEQKILPEGKLTIDGFLCLYDVSKVAQRSGDRQTESVTQILQQLVKTKKPIVLVSAKYDDVYEPYLKEIEKILARKDFKSANILVVETSAQQNVNVDQAFMVLAQLMDKTIKKLPKVTSYVDAAKLLAERKEQALETYRTRIRFLVTDYKCTWKDVCRKLKQYSDTQYFIKLFGSAEARDVFRRHIKDLRDQKVHEKQAFYMGKLQAILAHIFPDLASTQDR